jgi:hypothetical protein
VLGTTSYQLHVGFFLAFIFSGRHDEGNMLLRIVGPISRDYTALYPKRQNSSARISLKVKLSEPEADFSTFLS